MSKASVIFVCLGNICRSPTAEAVFRKLVSEEGCDHLVEIDSAGTHAYHVNEPPDQRAQAAAMRRGIDMSSLRGRRATESDIESFDYVLAMDSENYHNLLAISTDEYRHKIRLFMEFAPDRPEDEVPDPYYGGAGGFDNVLDMVEEAARGLLDDIRNKHG
ncbi:MAG: low molecular weight phosphotyrosine protein phosphatase [Proteobacteria bacterium]|nr:low molecular weight phosphotyrosine protein phosphatase [Pseudomonadota bacterium]